MAGPHTTMDKLHAYERLKKLADEPYDLTAEGAISADRVGKFTVESAGFSLLFAMQRVNGEVLETLQSLADETAAVEQFLNMKGGAVMNRIEGHESENRSVLHTACRDLFGASPHHPGATSEAQRQLKDLETFLSELDEGVISNARGETFTELIHVGIGGSDLGPRALYLAMNRFRKKGRKASFISNVDPDDAAAVLAEADLARALVLVVSKSGTTLETLTNEELVRSAYVEAGLDPGGHFVAVTGAGSPMDNPERYLRSFHMFEYIGGRYSATSMVGAVTLGFVLGYNNLLEILRGANAMDVAAEESDIRKNIPLMMALLGIWNRNFLGLETVAVLPYSQALSRFPAHLQQCDMESNGKSVTRAGERPHYVTGPIVWGEPGTNGQHAFYQLIHQGTAVVPVEFIGFRHSQYDQDLAIQGTTSQEKLLANLLAQSLALATGKSDENPNRFFPGNRPNSVLIADRLDPFTMGALLALYETKIAFQGFIWNINSFDQEGVQLGKVLATRLLENISEARGREPTDKASDPVAWSLLEAARLV